MKKIQIFLKQILSHQLIRGSLIMFLGATLVNFGNYIFHLLAGRMLGPSNYGILESIISSMYILSIVPLTLNLAIVKFVSWAKGKGEEEEITAFYHWLKVRLLIFGVGVSAVLLLILPVWLSFLKLDDYRLLVLASISFPFTLLLLQIRSFLQGLLNFIALNISTVSEVFFKVALSTILILAGFSVFGVILGLFLTSIITYLISTLLLKLPVTKTRNINFYKQKDLIFYSLPVLVSTLSLTSIFTTDIVLVKHYFSSFEAGIYASLSILGKIIFFASSSLVAVMFPLISQKQARGEKYLRIFWLTLLLVALLSLTISIIYLVFPELMIKILFGTEYLSGAHLLFWFGLFISFYALSNTCVNFFLSINKTRAVVFPLAASILQVVFISFWHQDLKMVIFDSLAATSLLFIGLLLYYPYATKS